MLNHLKSLLIQKQNDTFANVKKKNINNKKKEKQFYEH